MVACVMWFMICHAVYAMVLLEQMPNIDLVFRHFSIINGSLTNNKNRYIFALAVYCNCCYDIFTWYSECYLSMVMMTTIYVTSVMIKIVLCILLSWFPNFPPFYRQNLIIHARLRSDSACVTCRHQEANTPRTRYWHKLHVYVCMLVNSY